MRSQRYTLFLAYGGFFLIAIFLYGSVAPIEIGQEISDGTVVSISSGLEAGQAFTAHFPGLTEVSVQAARIPAGVLGDLQFRLTTYGEEDERILLSTADVHFELQGGWLEIQFPPQLYDAPQQYAFYLTSNSTLPIELMGHLENLYPEGTCIGEAGDLVFRARFRPSPVQTLVILVTRLASRKPGLLSIPWTYLLILIALFASLVGTTWQLILASTHEANSTDPQRPATIEPSRSTEEE